MRSYSVFTLVEVFFFWFLSIIDSNITMIQRKWRFMFHSTFEYFNQVLLNASILDVADCFMWTEIDTQIEIERRKKKQKKETETRKREFMMPFFAR